MHQANATKPFKDSTINVITMSATRKSVDGIGMTVNFPDANVMYHSYLIAIAMNNVMYRLVILIMRHVKSMDAIRAIMKRLVTANVT